MSLAFSFRRYFRKLGEAIEYAMPLAGVDPADGQADPIDGVAGRLGIQFGFGFSGWAGVQALTVAPAAKTVPSGSGSLLRLVCDSGAYFIKVENAGGGAPTADPTLADNETMYVADGETIYLVIDPAFNAQLSIAHATATGNLYLKIVD